MGGVVQQGVRSVKRQEQQAGAGGSRKKVGAGRRCDARADATALCRGDSRLSLPRALNEIKDATALSREGSRFR